MTEKTEGARFAELVREVARRACDGEEMTEDRIRKIAEIHRATCRLVDGGAKRVRVGGVYLHEIQPEHVNRPEAFTRDRRAPDETASKS